jgi:hypothetical protein
VLFAAGTFPLARDPANVLAYRNGGLADSLGMIDASHFHWDNATLVTDS